MMEKVDVLIVGGGGREHALGWKIRQSPRCGRLFAAPGNPGLSQIAECLPIQTNMTGCLVAFAEGEGIGLTVVGPEAPLADGIVDQFRAAGLCIFGPTQAASQIEADKEFTLALMHKHEVPTGWYRVFTDTKATLDFVTSKGCPVAAKNPFLAAGKGSFVCRNPREAAVALASIQDQQKGRKEGCRFLVMEFLPGTEVSITAITDGNDVVYLSAAQDHKHLFEGDEGPMTGGMGAIAPAPWVTPELKQEIHEKIVVRTLRAMAEEGRLYSGVLYAGLMLTPDGPKVLEFNCRFGDPEAQVVLPILEADLLEILLAACDGRLKGIEIPPPRRAAGCVVAASAGYPGKVETGKPVLGLDRLANWQDLLVFQAGTRFRSGETDPFRVETAGGRVVSVVGLGDDLVAAISRAQQAMVQFYFEGKQWRRDIGDKALKYPQQQAAP